MCNRYAVLAEIQDLQHRFAFDSGPITFRPQADIRPSRGVLTVVGNLHANTARVMRWGLIPHWTTDPSKAFINARAETLHQKTSFADPFRHRRCIIPATAFFERHQNRTTSSIFVRSDAHPFAFAAVWQPFTQPDGRRIATCAIITTPPNTDVKHVHDRMPAILLPHHEAQWLDATIKDPQDLTPLLNPYPDGLLSQAST